MVLLDRHSETVSAVRSQSRSETMRAQYFRSCDEIVVTVLPGYRPHNPLAMRFLSLWPGGKVQNLVDSIFECDQIPCYKFIAGAGEFVTMANLENFP